MAVEQTYTYTTTLDAAVDARALLGSRMASIDRVIDVIALLTGVLLIAQGYPIGSLFVVGGLGFLVFDRPIRRMILGYRSRGMVGQQTLVRVDDDAIHASNDLGSATIPWSSLTAVRADAKTVILVREGLLIFYLPAEAFRSDAERSAFEEAARDHIAHARQDQPPSD